MARSITCDCGKPMVRRKSDDGTWGWWCFSHTYLVPENGRMVLKAIGRFATDEHIRELEDCKRKARK